MMAGASFAFLVAACGVGGNAKGPSASRPSAPPARPDLYDCDGCEGASEYGARALDWRGRIGAPGEAASG